jgi:serine/threonine protein kinase
MNAENRCPACNAELAANAPRGLCPACLLKGGLGTETGGPGGSNPSQGGDFVPPTPAELAPHFPELEILELVGRGGMGVVYKARQKRLDRLVALKILSPKIAEDPAFADRFAREARAMAMLSHPHVVAVYDFGQTEVRGEGRGAWGEGRGARDAGRGTGDESRVEATEGQGKRLEVPANDAASSPRPSPLAPSPLYYFLMEFVDGVNLRQLLDSGKLAPEQALAIVPQICEALQYAHDHGLVHRDIKPANLLLDKNGQVKIADFGLAKLVAQKPEDLTLTGAGQVMGTPQYMAPEQIEHPLQVDHRADIYSLGVVFYQMLTGELPIGRFAPPSKRVQIDVRLDEVVLRALEKEPELRYQQASEIKTDVETITASPQAGAEQPQDRWQHLGYRIWAPLVVRRNGERVINWAALAMGVAFGLFAVLMASLAVALVVGVLNRMQDLQLSFLIAAAPLVAGIVAIIIAATIRLRRAFAVPLGRLPEPDGAAYYPTGTASSSSAVPSDEGIEQARQQVRGPVIGLLVEGILSLLTTPLFVLAGSVEPGHKPEPARLWMVLLCAAMLSALILVGALKMKRLESYGLAVIISILAIIISPGNLIGGPIGIWALVVLSQRDVRAAFRRKSDAPAQGQTGSPAMAGIALLLAAASGILGFCSFFLWPAPPQILVWSIPATALLGMVLAIPSRKSPLGRKALIGGSINAAIWLIIAALFACGVLPSAQWGPPPAGGAGAGGPLQVSPLPAGWKLKYDGTHGLDFYSLSPPQEGGGVLMFSRWPPPSKPEDIPALLRQIADGFVKGANISPGLVLSSEKYDIEQFAGDHCKGSYALFKIKNAGIQAMFMMSVDGQTWNGQFTGTPDDWREALGLLKALRSNKAGQTSATTGSEQVPPAAPADP